MNHKAPISMVVLSHASLSLLLSVFFLLFQLGFPSFFNLSDTGGKLGDFIFNWQFYSETYSVDVKNRKDAWLHYMQYGLQKGYLSHSGHKVMKVVLMTRNE